MNHSCVMTHEQARDAARFVIEMIAPDPCDDPVHARVPRVRLAVPTRAPVVAGPKNLTARAVGAWLDLTTRVGAAAARRAEDDAAGRARVAAVRAPSSAADMLRARVQAVADAGLRADCTTALGAVCKCLAESIAKWERSCEPIDAHQHAAIVGLSQAVNVFVFNHLWPAGAESEGDGSPPPRRCRKPADVQRLMAGRADDDIGAFCVHLFNGMAALHGACGFAGGSGTCPVHAQGARQDGGADALACDEEMPPV